MEKVLQYIAHIHGLLQDLLRAHFPAQAHPMPNLGASLFLSTQFSRKGSMLF